MFSSLRALVLLVAALQLTAALPATPSYKFHATHRTRALPNGFQVKTFHPKSDFEVFERGLARRDFASQINATSFRDTGRQFMRHKFEILDDEDDDDMDVDAELDGEVSHVWFRQRYAGIPIANTRANVAMNGKGDVLSYSSSFLKFQKPGKAGNSFAGGKTQSAPAFNTVPKLTPGEASEAAAKVLGTRIDDSVEAALEFLAVEDGSLKLTHSLRMHGEQGHVFQVYVGAEDGEVLGLVDFTSELTMRVVPVAQRDPNDGGPQLLKDVEDKVASPKGWLFTADHTYTSTAGNNVLAAKGDPTVLSVDQLVQKSAKMTGKGVFDYKFDPAADPTSDAQVNAATSNAWYVANMAHDILYRYGFTEKAFNFQDDNGDKGGKGADVVFLSIQDASGTNNANFVTLPEGQPGMMRMFLWDSFTPQRDGDFTNSVILHEYCHGLTNRLVGGGSAQCLQTTESRALGEGWSDAFAEWVWQTQNTHVYDFAIGSYVSGQPQGIREYPYSNSRKTNPLTYENVKDSDQEHVTGTIWAQTLHNVLATLVRQVGPGGKDALTNPEATTGHSVFMHLFVDSLALMPCNPTFVDARKAWIQADQNRYGAKHTCSLWIAFSYMGLGQDAGDYKNSVKLPADCKIKQ